MIKKRLITCMLLLASISCMAQFDDSNSYVRKTLLEYEMDRDGYYYKQEGALVEKVENVISMYAFDKKSSNLYVQTEKGNYVVVLNKENAKIYKNSKLAPIMSEKLIDAEVARVNRMLTERFDSINKAYTKHLRDSAEQVRLAYLEKLRQDSIEKARQEAAELEYFQNHDWHDLPINKIGLECVLCGHHTFDESVYCEGIINDSIYYLENATGILGTTYKKLHISNFNPGLRNEPKYTYHIKIFGDSLTSRTYLTPELVNEENQKWFTAYVDSVSKMAPNGYVESCGFDFQDNRLVYDFSYTNTNKKTIKNIEIHCHVLDAAGNVKKVIKLKANGPIKMLETKSWTWDDEKENRVPSNVNDARIGKLVITFSDGQQKILIKDIIYK